MGFDSSFLEQLMPYQELLWNNSSESFPPFMEKDFYTRYYPWCKGPDPAAIYPLMEEVCHIVRSNPAAARYASMLHFAMYKPHPGLSVRWVSPEAVFGKNTGIFQLMVALSSLPEIAARHAELNLPEKYLRGQAEWIGGTIGIYAAAHNGYPGHTLRQSAWLRYSVLGELFHVGRLEFLSGKWLPQMPAVYRSRKDHSLAVLCLDGWAFDSEGFRVDPNVRRPAFISRLNVCGGHVTGVPVSPLGKPVFGREMTLSLSEWEPLCSPWENCPSVHIPAGGGLTVGAVKQSLIDAVKFYHDFLNTDVKVFSCVSWILNPAWERELPNSNLADFQKNVYLTPCVPPEGNPGIFFVYGIDNCDPREKPQTTSLHKAFCRIFDRGEALRSGGMFLPASDVELYGTEYYRKKYCF